MQCVRSDGVAKRKRSSEKTAKIDKPETRPELYTLEKRSQQSAHMHVIARNGVASRTQVDKKAKRQKRQKNTARGQREDRTSSASKPVP